MAAAKSRAIAKHAAPAFSQEAAKKSGEEEIETVVIPGIRQGLAKSLEANVSLRPLLMFLRLRPCNVLGA